MEPILAGIDPAALSVEDACHLHHLRGVVCIHANDAEGAHRHWSAGARLSPDFCSVEGNLELSEALLVPPDRPLEANESPLRRFIHACRVADDCLARGDAAAAREALDTTLVHAKLELQSAARLAEAYLALEPRTPLDLQKKTMVLAWLAGEDLKKLDRWNLLPGLGWSWQRILQVVARAQEWLEGFCRPESCAEVKPLGVASAPAQPPEGKEKQAGPPLPDAHSLPPMGHEALREKVPGVEAVVREAVRYARAQPGWGEMETLGDDLPEFTPVKSFLEAYLERVRDGGMPEEEAIARVELLGRHLGYCVNFELHHRKLFFADASLAWLLSHTSLDIEGRALRLPFPCFGMAFTDAATLEVAQALLQSEGGPLAGYPLQILTVYVKRIPARAGKLGLSMSLVFDAHVDDWPYLLERPLVFTEDDDLDTILDSHPGDASLPAHQEAFRLPEMRKLVHLVINAVLYATSADVPWPLAQSPVRRLRATAQGRGEAKKARVAHRAQELSKQYSSEDVFFLPGRIPISQLRAFEQHERTHQGYELTTRFLVRGHWRRAAPSWHDQRVRWIAPHWKGPELAAIIEKQYKLKI